jgi:hypothetical protein
MAVAPNPVEQLRKTLILIGSILVAALLLVSVLLALLYVRGERPPFEYLDANGRAVWGNVTTYQAEDSFLCPGEPLAITISFRVNSVPITIRREYAVRSVQAGIPGRILKAGDFDPLVREVDPGAAIPYTLEGTVVGPARYVLPLPTLMPGQYVYEVVSSADDHSDNGFHTFFQVQACE